MQKEQQVLQHTIKLLHKKGAPDTFNQKANIQKSLQTLNSMGVLDFKTFATSEKDNKILVDEKEVNNILLNIERIKYGENYNPADGVSKISLGEMRKRISIINPNFPLKDLALLFQGKSELTSAELYEILNSNTITDLDPVAEAINFFVDDKDQLDFQKVSDLMTQLGYGSLDKQDQKILMQILDVNTDQKVDKQDLKEIFTYVNGKKN